MSKKNKLWGIILSICVLICVCSNHVYATGSGKVTLSSSSGTVGSTVTISGSISTTTKMAAAHVVMSYDQSGLKYVSGSSGVSGGSGSVQLFADTVDNPVKNLSFSIKFQILKQGSFKVNVESSNVTDDSTTDSMPSVTMSGGTITGKAPTAKPSTGNGGGTTTQPNKDGNNKLNSLQVYPGTLSPTFSADVTNYTVAVPGDTKDVTITATAASSKATVSVSGGKDLKLGPNEAKVIVVAENGSSVAYTITIVCGEVEKIQIEGIERTINENFTDEQIPIGFTRTKVTYKGREYEALTNATESLQLLYLKNDANSNFYIYNQHEQEFYDFVQVQIAEDKYIILLPLKDILEEFSEYEIVSIQIQDKQFDSWKLDDEFAIVCAINQDGQELLYRYDSLDGVFQRYVREKLSVSEDERIIFPSEYYMYAIVGLGALSIILFVAMIYFIASRKARHEGRKRKAIKRMEKKKAKEEKKRLKEEAELERIREEERVAREKQKAKEEKQRVKEEKKLAKKNKKNRDE